MKKIFVSIMLKTCPDPVDVQDVQFKLHCSLKIFNNTELGTFPNNYNLISCASKFGLLFTGSNVATLKAIQLQTVEQYTAKDKEISNFPSRSIPLPSVAQHISVNCDSTYVAVVVEKNSCSTAIFYDVLSFYQHNVNVVNEIRLSATPGIFATEVNWNPAVPNTFTACKSDGSLGIYELTGNSVGIHELPKAAECTSFCWSPKGKQIAVGSKNGNITQYKPDLKAVKVINAPIFENPHALISLCWVSNYQFIGVYQPAVEDSQAKLIVVDAPKTGDTSYTNYDDVCYSGSSRNPQFYLTLIQNWNMLMIASSNSMELGLLGAESEKWTQWNVPDFARAELPLGAEKQDTLPIGMTLDISNTKPLPWGEGTIPPCPYLLLLSHYGVLYFFNIVNLKQGAPSICYPPSTVDDISGIGQFVSENQEKNTLQKPQPAFSLSISQQQQSTPTQPIFVKPTPTIPISIVATNSPSQPAVPSDPSLFNNLSGNTVTIFTNKSQPPSSTSAFPPLFNNPSISLSPAPKSQTGVNEKYASLFDQIKPSEPLQVPSEITKTIVISSAIEPSATQTSKSAVVQTPTNTVKSSKPETSVDAKVVVDQQVKGEIDVLMGKMIRDECLTLESELKSILHQGRNINVNIGSDEEKVKIMEDLENLQEFIKDIVDVSLGESAEVHTLKQNLILSWAWYEEALSRYNISKDENVTLLLKNQPLDSAAEKRQTDIKKIIYYLESQLYQASKALDEQWDNFQDYAKKSYSVQMPTMETIYQSMVRQNAILQKQSYLLKDINNRLKHKKGTLNTPSLFLSTTDRSKLEASLENLQIANENNHRIFYEKCLSINKKLSSSKRNKLRSLLKDREVSYVTVAKPQLNSSVSLLRSPLTRNEHIFSILGAQMSPLLKPAAVKQLQFSESTPIKSVKEINPTSVPPNTPAFIDSPTSAKFTFKGPTTISSPTTNTSAFVPTIPTSKTLILPQQVSGSSFGIPTPVSVSFTKPQVVSFVDKNSKVTTLPTLSKPVFTDSIFTSKTVTDSTKSTNIPIGKPAVTESIFTPKTTAPLLFTPTTLPFGDDSSKGLFSFGKPSTVPQSSKSVSSPVISFGKSTDSTVKPTITVASSITLTPAFGKSLIPTSKPITLISSPKSIELVSSAPSTPKSTTSGFTFSFTSAPTTSSLISSGVTTTTTSLFGSISTSSVASIFNAKPSETVTDSKISSVPSKSTETVTSAPIVNKPKPITAVVSSSTSLFGSTNESTKPLFGSTTISLFSQSNTATTTSSSDSLFGTVTTSVPTEVSSSAVSTSPATTTTQQSIFAASSSPVVTTITSNTTTATTTQSIFGNLPTSSTQTSIFNITQPSVFGSSANTTATTTSSIFGSVATASTTTTTGSTSSSSSSIFGAPITTPSIFGTSTSTTPVFGNQSTTQSPIFSSAPPTGTTTSTSIFGTNTSTTSIFGSTQSSAFGTATSSVGSIFNSVPKTQASIFGSSTVTSTQGGSIFGSTSVTSSQGGSIFGSPSVTSTQSGSIFGAPSVTSSQGGSPFGSATVTSTQSGGSIFGSASVTSSHSGGSIFGSAVPATSSTSIFGSTTTTAPAFGSGFNQSGSIFGAPATTTAFGQSSTFGANSGSIFGAPTTSSSVFGAPTTASNIFGSPSNTFSTVSSSSNTFGSGAANTFSFASAGDRSGYLGFGDLNVGSPTAVSGGSIFGESPSFGQTPQNPFARTAEQKAPFGSTNTFGNSFTTSSGMSSNTPSIFGSNTNTQSTFGQSSFGAPSTFGQQSTFGQPSNFGNSSFGSTSPGPFSGGGVGVGQTGFGSPGNFPKPQTGGFGAMPVFGGSPQQSTFGGNPSFGGSPAFGAAPAFGSPSKVFGTSTASSGFGDTSNTGSTGFGNLATQNTIGFGNLAQQAATSTSAPFAGSSSFSSWR